MLPLPSFQSSCQCFNIMLSNDDIHTLANVVITDPTQTHLVFMGCFISWGGHDCCGLGKGNFLSCSTFNKCVSSHRYRGFGCLHQQVDNFVHQCGNMAWLAKGFGGPPLTILHVFYR